MSAIITILVGSLMVPMVPIRAPIPPEAPPDPTARGYMGIQFGTGTLIIQSVMPNLPAQKAGLRAGDSIVRVGTLEPQTFEQVIAHITSFRPGAVVEIEVQRGTERKTFKVKLASRPPELDQPNYYPTDDFPPP